MQAAVEKRFDDGIKFKRDLFVELVNTSESCTLCHAFFGERIMSKILSVPEDMPAHRVGKVAVIGAGAMGGDISMNPLNAGILVIILETKQEALGRGVSVIHKNYGNSAKKGKLTQERIE